MKRTLIASGVAMTFLTMCLMLARGQLVPPGPATVATPASSDAKKDANTLRTYGNATVRIKPDAARVFFGVQTQAATVKDARAENNRRTNKIMQALADLKIANLKMKTADLHVDILYGRIDGNHIQPITGYRVSNSFTVLIEEDDPAKLGVLSGQVLDAALEAGANSVQQVVFLSKSGMTEARREALNLAVEDALANARSLAAGANKSKIEAVTIEGQPIYREPYGNRNPMVQTANVAAPAGGDSVGTLVVGDLEISCQVAVVCRF